MMRTRTAFLFLVFFLFSTPVAAQFVEALTLRPGVKQNILILEPDGPPKASVVLFAGGDGEIGIDENGTIDSVGNFLVRSRDLFRKHGLRVAVYDMPDETRDRDDYRLSKDHTQDVTQLIRRLRRSAPAPVWLVGTSRGSISVAHLAATLAGADKPDGVVFTASVTERSNSGRPHVYDADIGRINGPALIVHHKHDACHVTPWSDQDRFLDKLERAQPKRLIGLEGGSAGASDDACRAYSHHGFLDIEEKAVKTIADWIKAQRQMR